MALRQEPKMGGCRSHQVVLKFTAGEDDEEPYTRQRMRYKLEPGLQHA
jgi:hypothetical protein